jgi:hypothetical protein
MISNQIKSNQIKIKSREDSILRRIDSRDAFVRRASPRAFCLARASRRPRRAIDRRALPSSSIIRSGLGARPRSTSPSRARSTAERGASHARRDARDLRERDVDVDVDGDGDGDGATRRDATDDDDARDGDGARPTGGTRRRRRRRRAEEDEESRSTRGARAGGV